MLAALLAGAAGIAAGVLAERIGARWPARHGHPVRAPGPRTLLLAAAGAAAFALLALRHPDPAALAVLLPWGVVLLVLLATDLEQRLLPDLLTLPLIPICLVLLVAGADPLLAGKEQALVSGIAAAIGAPVILLVSDRLLRGALGLGDVKLAVSLGLMLGISRFVGGFLLASIAGAVVLLALIALRRIGLRSAIPFGPILIGAALAGALLP